MLREGALRKFAPGSHIVPFSDGTENSTHQGEIDTLARDMVYSGGLNRRKVKSKYLLPQIFCKPWLKNTGYYTFKKLNQHSEGALDHS